MRSRLIVLSAVHKKLQQLFNFVGGAELANDTAELAEHDWLIMLSGVHNNVQKVLLLW